MKDNVIYPVSRGSGVIEASDEHAELATVWIDYGENAV